MASPKPVSADDLEAEAFELEAQEAVRSAAARAEILLHRARAKRLRAEASTAAVAPSDHMTRAEYAHSRRVSEATVSRWIKEGMPTLRVGVTHRIDPLAADAWRRTRAPVATTPAKKSIAANDDGIDISGSLSAAGIKRAR